ncbi:MAG: hypothetical protein ACOY4M_01165 [Pseudomonadota bacterium]
MGKATRDSAMARFLHNHGLERASGPLAHALEGGLCQPPPQGGGLE